MNIWQILEIEPTKNIDEVKLAYAKKLKQVNPESDPTGFQELRAAYEKAKRIATDQEQENEELKPQQNIIEEKVLHDTWFADPVKASHYIIDALLVNEESGFKYFEGLIKSSLLDNLDYSQKFQHYLAINLIAYTPNFMHFVCNLINYFKWEEQVQQKNIDGLYAIALRNLLNHARPYQFLNQLHSLSRIKNKKEAKAKNINWNDCCAAKLLLQPVDKLKYFYLICFCSKKVHAIVKLTKMIMKKYPESIGIGIDIKNYNHWYSKDHNIFKHFYNYVSIAIILFAVFGAHLSEKNRNKSNFEFSREFTNENLLNSKKKEISSEIEKQNGDFNETKSVAPLKLNDVKNKAHVSFNINNYDHSEYYNFYRKELGYESFIPKINTKLLNDLIKKNNINIKHILKEKLKNKIDTYNASHAYGNDPIILNIVINDYGLILNNKNQYSAYLKISVNLKGKTIINLYETNRYDSDLSFQEDLIIKVPDILKEMLVVAADNVVEKLINDIKQENEIK